MDELVVAEPEKRGLSNTAELTHLKSLRLWQQAQGLRELKPDEIPVLEEKRTRTPSLTQSELQWISAH